MRYGIISDIHSNLQALQKVLEIFDQENVDQIICLGDVVGYNANPAECIKILQERSENTRVILGNHDEMAVNGVRIFGISRDASDGMRHTTSVLKEDDILWLKALPTELIIEDPKLPFLITHGSPDPLAHFAYIIGDYAAKEALGVLSARSFKNEKLRLCFYGHSHQPAYIELKQFFSNYYEGRQVSGKTIDISHLLEGVGYLLLNPGSVGQPRGGCDSCFALLDMDKATVEIREFEYDYNGAQDAILRAGYSMNIAMRLKPKRK